MAVPREHLILCGGAVPPADRAWRRAARVVLDDPLAVNSNVHLQVRDITRRLAADLPDVVADLIELATYVYCGDQAVGRGGKAEFEYGGHWRRRLRFQVPVRRPDVWDDPTVLAELTRTLSFLSDDDYEFGFVARRNPPKLAEYLFGDANVGTIDTVMMFSGGLDSLAGAVEEVIGQGRRVALVSHRPVSKIDSRQQDLAELLGLRAADRGRPRPFHVSVLANKQERLGKEYTQRTRSFLFGAFGVAVARLLGLDGVKFYENGVVSLNLPVCAQVLGGRASRTTHPQVLWRMQSLFSRVTERPFRIENPFLWKTKTDVTAGVRGLGMGELIAHTVSCAHTWEVTAAQPHCGKCSQCIDRRLAAVAAGLTDAEDPAGRYRTAVLTGAFEGVEHQTMVERVVGMAHHVGGMHDPARLFGEFGEASRVLRYLNEPPDAVAQRVFELYRTQGRQVREAIRLATATHPAVAAGDECLVGIAGEGQAAAVHAAVQDDRPFAPNRSDVAILRVLAKSVQAILTVDLAEAADVSRKTTGRRVHVLVRRRLAEYPHGSRSGVALLPAGRQLLDRLDRSLAACGV